RFRQSRTAPRCRRPRPTRWAIPPSSASGPRGNVSATQSPAEGFDPMMRLLLLGLILFASGCGKEAEYKGRPVHAWASALQDSAPMARRDAAAALGEIGAAAKSAVPDLAQALHDPDVGVRIKVAAALWGMGAAARAAVPDLLTAVHDPNIEVRLNAVGALGEMHRAESLPALREALK